MRRRLLSACLAAALVGCGLDDDDPHIPQPRLDGPTVAPPPPEGPLERAGRGADRALDRAGEELREAGQEARDDLEETGDWIERKTDQPGQQPD